MIILLIKIVICDWESKKECFKDTSLSPSLFLSSWNLHTNWHSFCRRLFVGKKKESREMGIEGKKEESGKKRSEEGDEAALF